MNRIILICFFIFSVLSANGQSKNSLVFGNALVKDRKMQITGTVMTVAGGITLFAGNIMYNKVYHDFGNIDPPEDKLKTYRYIMFSGIGLIAAGIPIWAVGVVKERHIKIEASLVRFKGSASLNGIGLKVMF